MINRIITFQGMSCTPVWVSGSYWASSFPDIEAIGPDSITRSAFGVLQSCYSRSGRVVAFEEGCEEESGGEETIDTLDKFSWRDLAMMAVSEVTDDGIQRPNPPLEGAGIAYNQDYGKTCTSNSAHNVSIPVHSLPAELLLYIFELCMQYHRTKGYYRSLGELSKVCIRWYKLVQSSPALWTAITSSEPKSVIALALEKSSNLPLDVVYRDEEEMTNWSDLSSFVAYLQPYMGRLKTMDIVSLGRAEPIIDILRHPMPLLEEVQLVDPFVMWDTPTTYELERGAPSEPIFKRQRAEVQTLPAGEGITVDIRTDGVRVEFRFSDRSPPFSVQVDVMYSKDQLLPVLACFNLLLRPFKAKTTARLKLSRFSHRDASWRESLIDELFKSPAITALELGHEDDIAFWHALFTQSALSWDNSVFVKMRYFVIRTIWTGDEIHEAVLAQIKATNDNLRDWSGRGLERVEVRVVQFPDRNDSEALSNYVKQLEHIVDVGKAFVYIDD
ncbi:hypothetical protein M407DRAFT_216280 [Tulasnella calospora MUT 4182]|uniref:F-box domain-containing protein n=1 Tax=Tulasnella calospora MUT 4182 TaxID=1051891 RepID=A0A0C3QCY8_9AGAM|nr:hypothetical protein M407DRAFT_216280 [Tulasnella calospora MUT 4182]